MPLNSFQLKFLGCPRGPRAYFWPVAVSPNHVFLEHPNSDLSTQRTQQFAEPLDRGFLERSQGESVQ